MRKYAFLILLVLLSFRGFGQREKTDSLLAALNEAEPLNGVLLVADKDSVMLHKAFGYADFEWEVKHTLDSKFKIASLGKQFTALLILQLVEERKLSLDSRLQELIPGFAVKNADKITIRHLLNHTSGISNYHVIPDFDTKIAPVAHSKEEFLDLFVHTELLFEPGTNFHYSNLGYFLLAFIAEQVSGQTYDQLLQKKVFEKAGMKNTTTENDKTIIHHLARPYEYRFVALNTVAYEHPSNKLGMGTVITTAFDFYNYIKALNSGKLLGEQLRKEMFAGNRFNYGFGWVTEDWKTGDGQSAKLVYHDGGTFGYMSLCYNFYEDDKILVYFTNKTPANIYGITERFARLLYKLPYSAPKKSCTPDFAQDLIHGDCQTAFAKLQGKLQEGNTKYSYNASEMNRLGYYFLSTKQFDFAVCTFTVNTEKYPEEGGFWDSLGEGYYYRQEWKLAEECYVKALKLDPNNSNAKTMLEKIKLARN